MKKLSRYIFQLLFNKLINNSTGQMKSPTYLLLWKVTCSHRVNMMKGKETISLL